MIKLIHAADLHLDAPFSALPPEQAAQRRGEQRQLLFDLASLANREGAELVLLAGDLFDGADIHPETLEALAEALGSIRGRVFIAPGNHDYWSARSPYATAQWPENVRIFPGEALEAVDLPELGCVIHGAAFRGESRTDRVLKGVHVPEDGKLHIGLLHGEVAPESRYCPIPLEDIGASGLDYLALGHIHAGSGLQKAGNTAWAYPGCTEGRGFDELGEKGALLVRVEKGAVEAEFRPLCRRRYLVREVDVTDRDPAEALMAALPAEQSGDLCRFVLTGERGLDRLDLNALEKLAAGRYYAAVVRDHTRIRRDRWARAGENTLTGLFLREMRRRLDEAGDGPEREKLELAVRFGLAALENREDPR